MTRKKKRPLTLQPPGTIWDMGNGEKITFGEYSLKMSTEGDKMRVDVTQKITETKMMWTARIITDP